MLISFCLFGAAPHDKQRKRQLITIFSKARHSNKEPYPFVSAKMTICCSLALYSDACLVSGEHSSCSLGMAELEVSLMVSDVVILMFSKILIAKVKRKTRWTDKEKSARRKGLTNRTKSGDLEFHEPFRKGTISFLALRPKLLRIEKEMIWFAAPLLPLRFPQHIDKWVKSSNIPDKNHAYVCHSGGFAGRGSSCALPPLGHAVAPFYFLRQWVRDHKPRPSTISLAWSTFTFSSPTPERPGLWVLWSSKTVLRSLGLCEHYAVAIVVDRYSCFNLYICVSQCSWKSASTSIRAQSTPQNGCVSSSLQSYREIQKAPSLLHGHLYCGLL